MTTVFMGSVGPDVSRVQEMLNLLIQDGPPLRVDGIFGPKTQARVVQFQKQFQLFPDGIVGPLTGKALVAAVLAAMNDVR
jgi:peptidoglycan hydrolase-like protein with peptidoglycan-binding domain